MTLSVYKKLRLGNIEPTLITLTFADQSVKSPVGICEDVSVQVGDHWIPCDFIIFYMEKEGEIALILGRPFLATADIKFDFKRAAVEMHINSEVTIFDCGRVGKYPSQCFGIQHEKSKESPSSWEEAKVRLKKALDKWEVENTRAKNQVLEIIYKKKVKRR